MAKTAWQETSSMSSGDAQCRGPYAAMIMDSMSERDQEIEVQHGAKVAVSKACAWRQVTCELRRAEEDVDDQMQLPTTSRPKTGGSGGQ